MPAFPAHAGLNRHIRGKQCSPEGVPRTRGAEPVPAPLVITNLRAFPAHAGLNRSNERGFMHTHRRSPHTRG